MVRFHAPINQSFTFRLLLYSPFHLFLSSGLCARVGVNKNYIFVFSRPVLPACLLRLLLRFGNDFFIPGSAPGTFCPIHVLDFVQLIALLGAEAVSAAGCAQIHIRNDGNRHQLLFVFIELKIVKV